MATAKRSAGKNKGKGLSIGAVKDVAVSDKKEQLLDCEKQIQLCLREAAVCAGSQLRMIQDGELYQVDGYTSWESYVEERWDMSPQQARRLMAASDAATIITSAHIVCDDLSDRALMEFNPIYTDRDRVIAVAHKIDEFRKANPKERVTAKVVRGFVRGETPKLPAPEKSDAGTAEAVKKPLDLLNTLKDEYKAAREITKGLEAVMNADKEGWPAFIDANQKTLRIAAKAYREMAAKFDVWVMAHAKTVVEA